MSEDEIRERKAQLKAAFELGYRNAQKGEWNSLTQVCAANPFKYDSPAYLAFLNGARIAIYGPEIRSPWN
jgi:hypothetical protein